MSGRVARLHFGLGSCLAWWGWRWGAVRALEDAIHSDPLLADAHFRLGEALAAQGRWYEASRAYREAARLRPTDVDVQGNLALALGRAGLWDEAVATLRRLAHLRPLQAEIHVLVAAIQRTKLRRPAEAIRSYRWAIRLELPPRGVRFFLAEAILGAAAWEQALVAFREAKSLDPAPVSAENACEPGRSVLHHHPGGPVAVSIGSARGRTRVPGPLQVLGREWRHWVQAAAACRRRVGSGVRLLAGAAGAAERAPILHCYRQAPGADRRDAGPRPARPRPPSPSSGPAVRPAPRPGVAAPARPGATGSRAVRRLA